MPTLNHHDAARSADTGEDPVPETRATTARDRIMVWAVLGTFFALLGLLLVVEAMRH